MTEKPQGPEISQDEVNEATEGFKKWVTTLPEDQQRVFGWILTRAASADNDRAAQFGLESGVDIDIAALMANAAGLSQQGDVAGYMKPDYVPQISIFPISVWYFSWKD